MSKQTLSIEDTLIQLETLVEKMEAGDLSLEESLNAFEQGIALTKQCQSALKAAENKVQSLIKQTELDDNEEGDRKSTRLNSSHVAISYAVFCLKKKN